MAGMSPEAFASAAIQSDAYEIAAAQLMLTQTRDPRVRAFAEDMLQAHQKTADDIARAAQASGLKPPARIVGADQQRLLGALQSLKGPDLDRTYAVQQVNAHTSALVTCQGYAQTGGDPNLRRAAQAAAPLIEHHLEMARTLKAAMPTA